MHDPSTQLFADVDLSEHEMPQEGQTPPDFDLGVGEKEAPPDRTLNHLVAEVQRLTIELYDARHVIGELRDQLADAEKSVGETHTYIHQDATPTIHVKRETNSRGTNWEVSVLQVGQPDDVIALFQKVSESFKRANGLAEPEAG